MPKIARFRFAVNALIRRESIVIATIDSIWLDLLPMDNSHCSAEKLRSEMFWCGFAIVRLAERTSHLSSRLRRRSLFARCFCVFPSMTVAFWFRMRRSRKEKWKKQTELERLLRIILEPFGCNSLLLTFQRGVLVGADQSADAFDHLKFIVRISVFFLA